MSFLKDKNLKKYIYIYKCELTDNMYIKIRNVNLEMKFQRRLPYFHKGNRYIDDSKSGTSDSRSIRC